MQKRQSYWCNSGVSAMDETKLHSHLIYYRFPGQNSVTSTINQGIKLWL